MISMFGPSTTVARRTLFPLFCRGFSTSIHSIKFIKDPSIQGFKLSERLRQELVAELRENTIKEPPKRLDYNCLPMEGPEFDKMVDSVIQRVKTYKETNGL